MIRSARIAFYIWTAITFLIAVSLVWILVRLGPAGLGTYIQQPPLVNLPVTLASVALVWISAGALLFLLQSGRLEGSKVLSVAGLFVVAWAYLNFLSERWRYGDYAYYFEAANKLHSNQPLPTTYFYPPSGPP